MDKIFKLYSIVLVLLISFSCERIDETSGPKYLSTSGDIEVEGDDFMIVDSSSFGAIPLTQIQFSAPTNPDYIPDSVYFKASFSERATWIITVNGTSSGAVKTITGTGTEIEDAFWFGESDNIYFFKREEILSISLSFLGSDKVITKTLLLQEPKIFQDVTLVSDFELKSFTQGIVTSDDSRGWFDFFDVGEAIMHGIGPDELLIPNPSLAVTPVSPVQGNNHYTIRGKDDPSKAGSFFIGGCGHDPIEYGLPEVDPSEVYMNFYANPNGNKTTKLVVELTGIGGDLFTREIAVDWDDWRLINIRLSDFALTTAGEVGIGRILPSKLKAMKFSIHSANVPGNIAEINVDFITFTVGKPFKQQ